MNKRFLCLLLFMFIFISPFFSQVYKVEDASILASVPIKLNCYWEFFPNIFINPDSKTSSKDFDLGLISGYEDIFSLTNLGSVTDFDTFNQGKTITDSASGASEVPQYQTLSLLVEVPSSWNDYRLGAPFDNGAGAGSYRLLVQGLNPNKTYAFHVYDLFSNAFSIYINGEKKITVGNPSEDYTKTIPGLSTDFVFFKPDSEGNANIILHISNSIHRNGGAWNAISFAEQQVIENQFRNQLNYSFLCLGALLTIFLYQLFLFMFRKLDFGSLYLALFAITILIRLIVTPISLIEYFFPNIGYTLALKLEYIALIFGPMLFVLYMRIKMKKMLPQIIINIICAVGVILGVIVFSSNAYIANRFVPIIQTYTVLTCIYISFMMILSFLRKPTLETGLMVFATIATIVAAIHDIAAITNIYIVLSSVSLISYAFIMFVFIQTFIIARQQEKSHKSIIRLSDSLTQANKSYSRFVPKQLLVLLNKKSLVDIKPGDWISKKVTLLCFDIKNFSHLNEDSSPKEIFTLLNMILGKISPIVREEGGFIEKYLGDGIIAIFPQNGEKAFECALRIQKTISDFQEELIKAKLPKIQGGIGIHYGKIVLGTVGNNERLNQITVSKDIEVVMKLETLTRFCNYNIVSTRTAYEHWITNNQYNAELLQEDLTFQIGITEPAYGISLKNS